MKSMTVRKPQNFKIKVHSFSIFGTLASRIWNKRRKLHGKNILGQNIPLPTPQLRIYNDIGDFIGYRLFHSDDTTDPEPMEIDEPLIPMKKPTATKMH